MDGTTATKPNNPLAIASLVCGIICWFAVPVVGAIGAVVTGHMARAQIRQKGDAEGGDGMAVAGLILGYSHLAVSCLVIGGIVLMVMGIIGAGILHK
jgi:hypothetical protein